MRLNSTVCPNHILNEMPFQVAYAVYCIGKFCPETLEELAGAVSRGKVIALLKYLAKNHYAEISRVRYSQSSSGFGIVIHYGTMSCGTGYCRKTFHPFKTSKDRISLPYNKGFASFRNDHFTIEIEKELIDVEYVPEDSFTSFCKQAMKQIVANNPGRTVNTSEKSITDGARTLRQLHTIDQHSEGYIMDVVCWALQNDFWKKNVFSMTPLRAKSPNNGLKKFENMANGYMQDTGGNKHSREFGKVTTNKVDV